MTYIILFGTAAGEGVFDERETKEILLASFVCIVSCLCPTSDLSTRLLMSI